MTFESVALVALALTVLLLGVLVAGLLRAYADVVRRLDSLGVDESHGHELIMPARKPTITEGASDLKGIDPEGQPAVISTSVGTDPMLLAFLSTSCNSCSEFWENLNRPTMVAGSVAYRPVIVLRGETEESPTRASSLRRGAVDVVMSSQAWTDYEVPGAPYFVVVEPGKGISGEGSAGSFLALETFLADSTGDQKWDAERSGTPPRDNPDRIDQDLREAGILPGDSSLYTNPEGDE